MKYVTIVKGNITGVVQGDGAQVVIHDGKVVTPRAANPRRLIKCRKCGELVPDAPYCIMCGEGLR
jgi:hypothetical protein